MNIPCRDKVVNDLSHVAYSFLLIFQYCPFKLSVYSVLFMLCSFGFARNWL